MCLEKIDIIISSGYAYLIPIEVVERFQNRVFNLHASFLPWGKGIGTLFFSMLRFELKNISIYLIALVFIEGLLTFTIVIRNYFSAQYGDLIIKKKYADYIKQFKKYSFYSLMTAIFFTLCSVLLLLIIPGIPVPARPVNNTW